MRYVITGATGAIGLSLIKRLVSIGHCVTVLVNPSSERNKRFHQFETLKVIPCDQSQYSQLDHEETYDCFVHMAWKGGKCRNDITENLSSAKASVGAVELAHRLGCHTFLSIGSQAEYGVKAEALTETVLCSPAQPFGATKLLSYHLTRFKAKELKIRHFWMRVGSAYGPFDGEQTMLVGALRKLIAAESLSFTSGEQKWDFLHSDDIGNAISLLTESDNTGDLFVIGSGESLVMKDYLKIIGKKFNRDLTPFLCRSSHLKPQGLEIDPTKLQSVIDWIPSIGFETGIESLINYCKNN